jgi:hypothetical protein
MKRNWLGMRRNGDQQDQHDRPGLVARPQYDRGGALS